MEVTSANFTVPAMCHVVCTLVATGITGINVTNSFPAVEHTPPQHQLAPLPEGYVAYPDIGFAYKVHNESVSWVEARSRCIQEGAQLALIDSTKKIEYVKNQGVSSSFAHVGIVRMYDSTTWVGVATGLPVSSLPWFGPNPFGDLDCVMLNIERRGLLNGLCFLALQNYICEVPISQKSTIAAN